MSKLFVTEEMLKIKSDLELVNTDLEAMVKELNTNLDSIVLNWQGAKSKIVLAPVEGIKLKNIEIIEKIKAKSEEIGKAYETYLKSSETQIIESPSVVPVVAVTTPPSSTVEPAIEPTNTQAPIVEPINSQTPTVEPTLTPIPTTTQKSNNVTDMDSSGNYSRVINFQGANWNYFTMKDPLWGNWQLDRNSKGFIPLSRNGSHPFATINILANSGLLAGNKKDIVLDVLGVSGKQTTIDGKRVGDTTLNLTTGPVNVGNGNKYKTILSKAGITSTPIESLGGAIAEVEKGNLVHCIAQEGSSMAKYGHYLNLVGVEKDKSGSVTGLYVLDSLGRSQSEYDAITNKSNSGEMVHVIQPGLVRIDASKENLNAVRLASFRAIEGGKSQTKTVFSYEEYLNQL